jgi:predicted SAM-dependent methyltransferase
VRYTIKVQFLNVACGDHFILNSSWENIDFAPKCKEIKQGNVLKGLPYKENTFEIVYSSHLVEHISRKDILNFLIECRRVLKPGGLIRLVLPDFEKIAREYLKNVEQGKLLFSEFNIIEMIDQCVRTESGGEMIKWYRQNSNSSLQSYIKERTGHNPILVKKKSRLIYERLRNLTSKKIALKIQIIYSQILVSILPNWFVSNHISKAATGEKHLWMYDFNTLSNLLDDANFTSIVEVNSFKSSNSLFPIYPLDIDSNNDPRKGLQSMYIEAIKPIT